MPAGHVRGVMLAGSRELQAARRKLTPAVSPHTAPEHAAGGLGGQIKAVGD